MRLISKGQWVRDINLRPRARLVLERKMIWDTIFERAIYFPLIKWRKSWKLFLPPLQEKRKNWEFTNICTYILHSSKNRQSATFVAHCKEDVNLYSYIVVFQMYFQYCKPNGKICAKQDPLVKTSITSLPNNQVIGYITQN